MSVENNSCSECEQSNVYKDDIIKFYNGEMKGADLPVFTPLKAVKNPGIS